MVNIGQDKRNFVGYDSEELPSEKIERGGMFVVLNLGVILLVGGLFFAWKLKAFDLSGFFGEYSPGSIPLVRGLFLLHCPWIAGAWMLKEAIKYFEEKRKK